MRAAIPAAGIAIGSLVAKFKSRAGTRTAEFIHLVKQAGQLSKDPAKVDLIELKTAFQTLDDEARMASILWYHFHGSYIIGIKRLR